MINKEYLIEFGKTEHTVDEWNKLVSELFANGVIQSYSGKTESGITTYTFKFGDEKFEYKAVQNDK